MSVTVRPVHWSSNALDSYSCSYSYSYSYSCSYSARPGGEYEQE